MRGYFEIGVYHLKTEMNMGTLWRSAYQLGAAGIFTIGRRYVPQASNTYKADRHIPFREFDSFDEFHRALPHGAPLIGVEMGGTSLSKFYHPERAIYLLGAEDAGLPIDVLARCHAVVSLDAIKQPSYNVAVAGSLVMYDRQFSGKGFGFRHLKRDMRPFASSLPASPTQQRTDAVSSSSDIRSPEK
jgi:tRNA G18 (ribose-2'-O)-methylase SpoU